LNSVTIICYAHGKDLATKISRSFQRVVYCQFLYYYYYFFFFFFFSSSSMCGAGRNPAYRTSASEAVCTLTPILFSPFISRDAPRQMTWETFISERRNYGWEMACQI
jgi:hypothetical protein